MLVNMKSLQKKFTNLEKKQISKAFNTAEKNGQRGKVTSGKKEPPKEEKVKINQEDTEEGGRAIRRRNLAATRVRLKQKIWG